MSTRRGRQRSAVPLWITGVCIAVVVYASLQPFTGWTALAPNTPFFLWQTGQRWTARDFAFNVLAYVPLGFALVASLPARWRLSYRAVTSCCCALLLACLMEAAQMWLPTRYASAFDVLANLVGALIGSIIAVALLALTPFVSWIERTRAALVVAGASGDLQLVLLAVWLLAQTNPAIPLFAATFHPGQQAAFEPAVIVVEFAQTAAALIGIGLFTDLTMRKRWLGGIALVLVIALAVTMKTAAAQAVLKPVAWEEWLRPGHALGLAGGAFALMILFWLPRRAKSVLAGISLLTGVLVTLLLPDFLGTRAPLSIFSWNYGHLLHLNGLTHTIIILWPFLATAVLFWRFVATSPGKPDNTEVTPTIPR
jgi:VanZ family protein